MRHFLVVLLLFSVSVIYSSCTQPPDLCANSNCHLCEQGCDPATGQCTGKSCGGDICQECDPSGTLGCRPICKESECEECRSHKDAAGNIVVSCLACPPATSCSKELGRCAASCENNQGCADCEVCENKFCVDGCGRGDCTTCTFVPETGRSECKSSCIVDQQECHLGRCVSTECNPACSWVDCEVCDPVKHSCVSTCGLGSTCDGKGKCKETCNGFAPTPCHTCVGGQWRNPCRADGCSECDAESGLCKSRCASWQGCFNGECVERRGDCSPECLDIRCESCLVDGNGNSGCWPYCLPGQKCADDGVRCLPSLECNPPCLDDQCMRCDGRFGVCTPCEACLVNPDGTRRCDSFN